MENSDKALNTGAKRVYDVAPSEMFAEFMKTGWTATPSTGITQDEVISHCVRRRAALSAAFTGVRLVIPSGGAILAFEKLINDPRTKTFICNDSRYSKLKSQPNALLTQLK